VADARLCRALGVGEVVVFQLKGALEKHGQEFVARLNTAVNHDNEPVRLPFSRPASLFLFGTAVLGHELKRTQISKMGKSLWGA